MPEVQYKCQERSGNARTAMSILGVQWQCQERSGHAMPGLQCQCQDCSVNAWSAMVMAEM